LYYSGLTKDFVQIAKAKNVGPSLEKEGFTNIFNKDGPYPTPASAPPGAVLVFSAPGLEAGHVTFKTAPCGQDGYKSDFIEQKPARMKLIGIYVKDQ
jgi:hypothetical protein